jgi:hypothetical protein
METKTNRQTCFGYPVKRSAIIAEALKFLIPAP